MNSFNLIFLSLLGGVLPALFWLWFWLKEDRLHPEPRTKIAIVFLSGMVAIFAVLPLERLVLAYQGSELSPSTILIWACIEEIAKFIFCYVTVLRGKEVDEPIDPAIYLITAALGFSALENALFLSNLIDLHMFSQSVVTGNSRFLGATLLHVVSSASIGVMLGLSYYRKKFAKTFFLVTGLLLAIVLHTIFNLLIIKAEKDIFLVFAGVWTLVITLIVLMEKIKTLNK